MAGAQRGTNVLSYESRDPGISRPPWVDTNNATGRYTFATAT